MNAMHGHLSALFPCARDAVRQGVLAMMPILACVISSAPQHRLQCDAGAAESAPPRGRNIVPLPLGTRPNGAIATQDSDYIGGFFVDFYRELGNTGNFDVTLVPIQDNNYLNDFTGVTMKLLDADRYGL